MALKGEEKEWLLPASIPFENMKGKDLEECLYWLLDAMGAKDLEWRTGGSGGGASDGGRDIEAHFYTPTADHEMEPQVWWVECKGRTGTVEPFEVKNAIVNAQAKGGLDYIVVATNTQFSNPTRDWVKDWQKSNARPKVKLWDNTHLERLLSRHPDVAMRLFSEALSLDGQLQALEARFWNKLEFVSASTLQKLWKEREKVTFTAMGLFAVAANEFANGDINRRPWVAAHGIESVVEAMHMGFINAPYLMMRAFRAGVEQAPLIRTFAYMILCALDELPGKFVAQLVTNSITRGRPEDFPDEMQAFLLVPIADQLLTEMQDICSEDCARVSTLRRHMLMPKVDVDEYWLRLEAAGIEEPEQSAAYLLIEHQDEPCQVGFDVNREHGCPLFGIEPSVKNCTELLDVIKRVAAYRKARAAEKRDADVGNRPTENGVTVR